MQKTSSEQTPLFHDLVCCIDFSGYDASDLNKQTNKCNPALSTQLVDTTWFIEKPFDSLRRVRKMATQLRSDHALIPFRFLSIKSWQDFVIFLLASSVSILGHMVSRRWVKCRLCTGNIENELVGNMSWSNNAVTNLFILSANKCLELIWAPDWSSRLIKIGWCVNG